MKKIVLTLLILTALTSASCIVAPAPGRHGHVRYVAPSIEVRYIVRGGTRIYLLPRYIRPGDIIVIQGVRCRVKAIRKNRVKIIYPDGISAWINVEFR